MGLTLPEQKTRVDALAPSPIGRHLNPSDPYPIPPTAHLHCLRLIDTKVN